MPQDPFTFASLGLAAATGIDGALDNLLSYLHTGTVRVPNKKRS